MSTDSSSVPKRSLTAIGFILFLRGVALLCFAFGLDYWAMITGYRLEGQARFDLLPFPWQVTSAALAVLFPVAAVGTWLTVSWGPVIWLIAGGIQTAMYTVWPDIFGHNLLLVILNVSIAVLWVAFALTLRFQRRQRQAEVTDYSP